MKKYNDSVPEYVWIVSLSHCGACASVNDWEQMVKTMGLKEIVHVCTACIIVSLSTTSLNFVTPPLTWFAPIMQESWAKPRKRRKKSSKKKASTLHTRRLKVITNFGVGQFINFALHLPVPCTLPLLCFVLQLLLLSCSVHREKYPNLYTIHWFHSACTSVSMFTINVDNCLFLYFWFQV